MRLSNHVFLKKLVSDLLAEAYYDIADVGGKPSIDFVISEWVKGHKAYDPEGTFHAMYSPEEIWPYREYTWSAASAAGSEVIGKDKISYQDKWHFVPLDDEGLIVGKSRWDWMTNELKTKGWNPRDPLYLEVGKNGVAKVGEGNHRLAIARELNINVPVFFSFKNRVEKSGASNV